MSSEEIFPNVTVGLDLGDKVSRVCEIDFAGKIVKTAAVSTTLDTDCLLIEGAERLGQPLRASVPAKDFQSGCAGRPDTGPAALASALHQGLKRPGR